MLVSPNEPVMLKIKEERKALVDHYNKDMEKILNENSAKEKYWILGKVRFPPELGGKVGRTFLQACEEKPALIANAFLYEVDNKRGVKEILWIMNPDGSLRIPSLNKTIQAMPSKVHSVRAIDS